MFVSRGQEKRNEGTGITCYDFYKDQSLRGLASDVLKRPKQ